MARGDIFKQRDPGVLYPYLRSLLQAGQGNGGIVARIDAQCAVHVCSSINAVNAPRAPRVRRRVRFSTVFS